MLETTALKTSPWEKWLREFERDPLEALDRLLLGKAYMGRLDRNDTDEILFRLFHAASTERKAALDDAMLQWLQRYWENAPRAVSASRWGEILQNAFAAIARLPLRPAQDWLLAQHARGRVWLRGLYLGPERDPEAAFLRTLAHAQHDLRLLPLWMRLCRLEEDRPLYYAGLGLLGLRKLPGENNERHGDLHTAVFRALVDLANAIDQRPRLRQEGEKYWLLKARGLMARYPRSTQYWTEHFYPLVSFQRDGAAAVWLGKLIPNLRRDLDFAAPGPKQRITVLPLPSKKELDIVLELLRSRPLDEVRVQLREFLSKHLRYAKQTGYAEILVIVLSKVANFIYRSDAQWALELIQEAFLWTPDDSFLWTARAKIEVSLGHNIKAMSLLWEAKRRFPEIPQVRNHLAEFLLRFRKSEIAEHLYRQTIVDFPGEVVCRNGFAKVLVVRGKLHEAEQVYRQTMIDFPGNTVCRNGLAGIFKMQGKLEDAKIMYSQTIRDFPENPICRVGLAGVLKVQRNFEDAENVYREAMKAFPENVMFRNSLAKILRIQGKLPEAERVFKQAIKDFPKNTICRNGLAEVLKEQGRLDEAEKIYRQTMMLFPNDVVCRNGLAEILRAQGKFREAEAMYRQVIIDFPEDAACRNGLAGVLKEQKKLDEAEKVYRQTAKDFPLNIVSRNGLAQILKAQSKLEDAEREYRRAIQDFAKDTVSRNGLAEILKAQGKLEASEAIYRQTMKEFPENTVCRNGLAEVLKTQGKLEDAEVVYRQTMKKFPENAVCRNGLAQVLKAQGNLEEAEMVYRQAIKDFPNDIYCRTGLAVILSLRGKKETGYRLLKKNVKDFPNDLISQALLKEFTKPSTELSVLGDLYGEFTVEQDQEEQADDLVDQAILLQEERSLQEILPALSSAEPALPQHTEARAPLPREDDAIAPQTETLEPSAEVEAPLLADEAFSFEESNGVEEAQLGLANLYRLAARHATDETQVRFRRLFRETLAQAPQNILAALEQGFEHLERDPQDARSFFEHQQDKQPHVLGLHLGYLQARRKTDETLPAAQWQELFEKFPHQRTLIALAAAQAELRHGNDTSVPVLERLRKQMQAPLANLPSTLQANEQWVRATVEKRLFENLDLSQPFSPQNMPLVLTQHAQHDFILQGVLEQSLTNF